MYSLGINAAFHDSAAALVRDGELIAAAEEERFSRIKHAKRPVPFSAWELPFGAIDYCLAEAGIVLAEVDQVAYSFDPSLFDAGRANAGSIELPLQPSAGRVADASRSPWDPLFLSYVVNAPRQLAAGAPHHLQRRFKGVRHDGPFRWRFVPHHAAHEASAYLAAPFESCAVMTLDGRGERATTTFGVYRDGSYRRLKSIDVPHSLGLLYEDVTRHLGFLHSSDEYKVMALASYGTPRYLDAFRDAVRVAANGDFRLGPLELAKLTPRRERGAPLEPAHFDLAASLQRVLEESALALARWLREASGERRLAMAGGVALNCVMNARLRDSGLFERVWVQPAAGDAGTALGAALWADADARGSGARAWRMEHAYYGPSFSDAEIERALAWSGVRYRRMTDPAEEAAQLLAAGAILGWFQGRMEFGPRALGARSILASPLEPDMQQRLNELKDREDFRPVAPVVIEEAFTDWFVRSGAEDAPFMLFVYQVRPDRAQRIPAVRHVDGTARVQTIRREHNPPYYDVVRAFGRRTGVPVLVNTSFNTRGEPIVCTPRDALESFWTTPLDALVIGPFLVDKAAR